MSIKSFKGGVHPPERKAVLSSDDVVRVLPSNKSVWIPVTQGGMPNTPLVNVGDLVARGQKIAETDKFFRFRKGKKDRASSCNRKYGKSLFFNRN